jgi:hypothetical protein
MNEKRQFHRVGHDASAVLVHAANSWPCTVEDLSLKGGMVKLEEAWSVDPGLTYRLGIYLSEDVRIDMDVRLSHQQGMRAGFHCVSIDSDSVGQLKRLVELNLGDSALLERDMHALLSGGELGR